MYSAFREFLSFETIEKELDKLFRLYVDFVLINSRTHFAGNDRAYLYEAGKFREYLNSAPGTPVERKISRSYLYWFDVRAAYWQGVKLDPDFIALIGTDNAIAAFKKAADSLHDRLEVARKYCAPKDFESPAHGTDAADRCLRLLELVSRHDSPYPPLVLERPFKLRARHSKV